MIVMSLLFETAFRGVPAVRGVVDLDDLAEAVDAPRCCPPHHARRAASVPHEAD